MLFGTEISRCFSLETDKSKALADVFLQVNHTLTGDLKAKGQILPKGTCQKLFKDQTFYEFAEKMKLAEKNSYTLPHTQKVDGQSHGEVQFYILQEQF